MEQQMRLAKQFVDLQKVMVEGLFNSMITFWDQTEKMFGPFVDQAVWFPAEGRGILKEWIGRNKQGFETFKNAANEGFNVLEGMLNGKPKQQPPV